MNKNLCSYIIKDQKILSKISEILNRLPIFQILISALNSKDNHKKFFLTRGALRDILRGCGDKIDDLDIITNVSLREITIRLSCFGKIEKNYFGGISFLPHNSPLSADIWNVANSRFVSKNENNIINAIRYFEFNAQTLIYDLFMQELFDPFAAMRDFNNNLLSIRKPFLKVANYEDIGLLVLKAAYISAKTGLMLQSKDKKLLWENQKSVLETNPARAMSFYRGVIEYDGEHILREHISEDTYKELVTYLNL